MTASVVSKTKAPRNRTLTLTKIDESVYGKNLIHLSGRTKTSEILDRTIHQDLFETLPLLPKKFVDLLFIDPPYNLTKEFNSSSFRERSKQSYQSWFESWFESLMGVLKPTATVYVCGDWRSSGVIETVVEKYLKIQNRITWEREKGRGAKMNWKNCSEDIWFCTMGDDYTFHADAVMLKRKVIAPYKDQSGKPKDWAKTSEGAFRLTHPSNLWTDLSVPFWSMPENTDHPTQKPEKLLAKLLLASSNKGDVVLDPFLGSGTTSVVAKKLGRRYVGIERDEMFCMLAEKRLALASHGRSIQGYDDGVFWERNSNK